MKILVTGGAGFIGSHLVDLLLKEDHQVDVVDNFDPFYDSSIKKANIAAHLDHPNYKLHQLDIRDLENMRQTLPGGYDAIVHLAAKAGVRPSIEDPISYQEVNVRGTQNLLELAKVWKTPQFVFASSSSVYGVNPRVPWREDDHVLMPISPYASTKVSGELLGHVYSHLYGIRFIGLRFFTVYGPRQRPDLAIHKFARMILDGKSIPVFGDGSTRRDYTYIDDIVAGIRAAIDYQGSRFEIVNLGNNQTITLSEMIATIENSVGAVAKIDRKPEQPGDVSQTWADSSLAEKLFAFKPSTPFKRGIADFSAWLATLRANN
jgi:UDP-glucuronate 4-epimerase